MLFWRLIKKPVPCEFRIKRERPSIPTNNAPPLLWNVESFLSNTHPPDEEGKMRIFYILFHTQVPFLYDLLQSQFLFRNAQDGI